jgi:putative transposase
LFLKPIPQGTTSRILTGVESYTPKYEKAADCLSKDRDTLLAFYDFPAEHWKHLRTTNRIESTFATVRHRTIPSKGCLSNRTALAMVFKLLEAAQKGWRRLDGHNQLPKLVLGVTFNDGIVVIAKPTDRQAATAAWPVGRHQNLAIAPPTPCAATGRSRTACARPSR